jgi:CBS domain-containing protein
MKASDIMSKNPRTVTPDTAIAEAARLMKTEDVGVLPVVESDSSRRLLGMITDRDITVRVVAEGKTSASVRDAMTSSVRSCSADDSVQDVMELMGREQVRRVPIVDDRGELVGIVAQADIVLEGDDARAEATIEQISQPGGSHNS